MYPYRIVVDTNRLNAKGRLPAMNELQHYHDIGAIELVVTSTVIAEVDPGSCQAAKAGTYQSIGGEPFSIDGVRVQQSRLGATVRQSKMHLLVSKLFGYELRGHTLIRALRDCLHVDQAQMNAADILVTDDKRLYRAEEILRAEQVQLIVTSPEIALEMVKEYLRVTQGTDDLQTTKANVSTLGPIIIGSNSARNFSISSGVASDPLISFRIDSNGFLRIGGALRDESGEVAIVLHPGESPEFPIHKASIIQEGRGPLLGSAKPAGTFIVKLEDRPILAVRMTHTGRAVVFAMELRNEHGSVVAHVVRETLVLCGSNLAYGEVDG